MVWHLNAHVWQLGVDISPHSHVLHAISRLRLLPGVLPGLPPARALAARRAGALDPEHAGLQGMRRSLGGSLERVSTTSRAWFGKHDAGRPQTQDPIKLQQALLEKDATIEALQVRPAGPSQLPGLPLSHAAFHTHTHTPAGSRQARDPAARAGGGQVAEAAPGGPAGGVAVPRQQLRALTSESGQRWPG